MSDAETKALVEELRQYEVEKEKIRQVIGQIGGKSSVQREKAVNIVFIIALIVLFVVDVCRHFFGINVPLPPLFSLEVGILLVSVKIIWMIHSQTKVEHFQFWMLNSIEFRVNQITSRLHRIEKHLKGD